MPILRETCDEIQNTARCTQADESEADAVSHMIEIFGVTLLEGVTRVLSEQVSVKVELKRLTVLTAWSER